MARGINKVIIVGNLGQDPETRNFPDGGTLTTISVATSEAWKDKQTGQPQERTEWHRVTFNGRLAEIAAQYLRKGSKVYVEGSLRTRKYQDKQTGADRYSTDIMAREMQMLGGESGGQQTPQQAARESYDSQQPPSQQAPRPQQSTTAPPAEHQHAADGLPIDDDIPF